MLLQPGDNPFKHDLKLRRDLMSSGPGQEASFNLNPERRMKIQDCLHGVTVAGAVEKKADLLLEKLATRFLSGVAGWVAPGAE